MKLKKFDVYFDKGEATGKRNSYWIVYMDNDKTLKVGRMGPFNTDCDRWQLNLMQYVGNYGEDKSLSELWKTNAPPKKS